MRACGRSCGCGRGATGTGGSALNGPASGIGPAHASTSSWLAAGIGWEALTISLKGAGGTGRTTELVVSAEVFDWSMMLSTPELDVQPVKAAQARAMTDTTEERMSTRNAKQMGCNAPPELIAIQSLRGKAESKVYEIANAKALNRLFENFYQSCCRFLQCGFIKA